MADDADDVEVVASGVALQQVSSWLGVDAEAVLAQETDPSVEAMFNKPHPLLLGLGAKYLSHKSMEASGVEQKLRHKLRKTAEADGQQQYQPAQLDRHQHKRRKHEQQQQQQGGPHLQGKQVPQHLQQQQQHNSDSDDEDAKGKIGRLQQKAGVQQRQGSAKQQVLDRSALLQVPTEQLSKWQRKRQRQKAKKQQQQQQQ